MLCEKAGNVQKNKPVELGISVFTVCMNRGDNLYQSLKTWLACSSIDEIIIVDWSSEDAFKFEHEKVSIFRVEGQSKWLLSKAFNLSARLTSKDKICKLDCDYKISEDFFSSHELSSGIFFSGNEKLARNSNERYTNGFLYLYREDFFKANGYNENIKSYGYDDTDISERLRSQKLKQKFVVLDKIEHISHDDSLRLGFKNASQKDCETLISQNKKLSEKKRWSNKSKMTNFYACGNTLVQNPTLATSIPPFNLDTHKVCVQSWVKSGFDVISINKSDEIKFLEEHFPSVKFVESKKNSSKHFGKPLIYIDELVDALEAVESDVVGICNSDIYINSPPRLQVKIVETINDSLIALQRTDVDSDGNKKLFKDGFDLFVFKKDLLKTIPRTEKIDGEPGFCLGMPWWDYFIPMTFLNNKKNLLRFVVDRGKFLDDNIIFHREHKSGWNFLSYSYFNRKFLEEMKSKKIKTHNEAPMIIRKDILSKLKIHKI